MIGIAIILIYNFMQLSIIFRSESTAPMRKIYITTSLLLIPVIILITYSGLKSNDAFSENLINSLSQKLDRELTDLLDQVRNEIFQIIQTYPASSAFSLDEDSLAKVFIPMISRVPAIGSIMLYNSDGQSLTAYREKNTFVTGLQNPGNDSTGLVWNRRLRDNSISSSWSEIISGQDHIFCYRVRAADRDSISIARSLQTLAEKYFTGGIDSPQDSILLVYLNNWNQHGGNMNMTYHHRLPDDDWWLHIRPFQSFERIDAVGLAVSER